MNNRVVCHAMPGVNFSILPMLAMLLLLTAGFLAAQVTISARPLSLFQVEVIYVAPSGDDFVGMLKSHLERWDAIWITSEPEEADAILSCQTERRIVPAKMPMRVTTAEVTLIDRRTQRLIWRTSKSTALDSTALVQLIIEQLKEDHRKAASEY